MVCYSKQLRIVVFEVLGMLARPLHIKDRPFTYLPNPVAFPLNKQAFSPRRLLHEFQMRLHEEMSSPSYEQRSKEDALYRVDSWATRLNSGLPQLVDGDYSPKLLNQLHEAIDGVDKFLLEDNTKDVVLDVLRRHVQEVLLAINTSAKDVEFDSNNSPTTVASSHHPASAPPTATHPPNLSTLLTSGDAMIQQNDSISFDYLLKIPHEKREWALMKTYFSEIRFRAVSLSTSQEYHDPQAAEASRDIHKRDPLGLALQPIPTNETATAEAAGTSSQTQHSTPQIGAGPNTMSRQTTFTAAQERFRRGAETWGTLGTGSVLGAGFNRLTHPNEIRRDTIWCALVFRMICWLLLHDFDKKDLQIPKSELMGSRLPVFIV